MNFPSTQQQGGKGNVTYATFGDRFFAFIIDVIIFGILTSYFLGGGEGWISYLISFVLFCSFEFFTKGQTLGKMAMKLRTVDAETFGELSLEQILLHNVTKVILLPLDIIFGFFANDNDPARKNQIRYTQRYSKTAVIKEERI